MTAVTMRSTSGAEVAVPRKAPPAAPRSSRPTANPCVEKRILPPSAFTFFHDDMSRLSPWVSVLTGLLVYDLDDEPEECLDNVRLFDLHTTRLDSTVRMELSK